MGITGAGGARWESWSPWVGVSTDPLARVPAEDRGVYPVRQEQQCE